MSRPKPKDKANKGKSKREEDPKGDLDAALEGLQDLDDMFERAISEPDQYGEQQMPMSKCDEGIIGACESNDLL